MTSALTLRTLIELHGVAFTLKICRVMGCNTSQGAKVVDPSEKPEERPKSAASTGEASTEETDGAADADQVKSMEASS